MIDIPVHFIRAHDERGFRAGFRRQWNAISRNLRNKHGLRLSDGLDLHRHVCGANGELAVHLALGIPWTAEFEDTFKGPDLGDDVQVRCRSKHWHQLYVRVDEPSDHRWVLVTGRSPDFLVRGWLWGWEVKQWPLKAYGGREPAHFVEGPLRPFKVRQPA
jgi:hypothetical protein